MQLHNYIAGQWVAGTGKQSELVDASTGELVATTRSGGLDFGRHAQLRPHGGVLRYPFQEFDQFLGR
jgi:hypothetical protein